MKINLRFFYGFEKNKNIWVEVMTVAQPKQDKIVLHKMILQLFPSHWKGKWRKKWWFQLLFLGLLEIKRETDKK